MIGDRWGVTDEETRRAYPCDGFVTRPTLVAWRGVTVDAGSEVVWRRVRQLRLAPYSYDALDNLGRRSPRECRDLPDPEVGDVFTHALGRDRGTVVAVVPGEQLTASIMGTYLPYVVESRSARTRLLLKVVGEVPAWVAPALCVGDLVMASRQLRRLATLAARDGRAARG